MALIGINARVLCSGIRGGMGQYVQHLIEGLLADSSHSVQLYHHTALHEDFRLQHERLKSCQISDWDRGRFFLWEQFSLPRQLSRDKLDIFHSPDAALSYVQPCPSIVTVHDVILNKCDDGESRKVLFYSRRILPSCFRKAKRVITDSEVSKQDLVHYLRVPEEKIRVVYLGVSDFYRPLEADAAREQAEKSGLPDDYIFMIGAASPHKNIDRAVEAFIRFKKNNDVATKMVINVKNAGTRASIIEKLTNHGLKDQAVLLSYLPQTEVRLLYNRASLFLFPSLAEGFGLPPLEAMACGAPVAASNASCIPEIVGAPAVYFDPLSVEEMANAIAKVIGSQETAGRLRRLGYEHVKKFTWQRTVERTLAVYQEVLAGA